MQCLSAIKPGQSLPVVFPVSRSHPAQHRGVHGNPPGSLPRFTPSAGCSGVRGVAHRSSPRPRLRARKCLGWGRPQGTPAPGSRIPGGIHRRARGVLAPVGFAVGRAGVGPHPLGLAVGCLGRSELPRGGRAPRPSLVLPSGWGSRLPPPRPLRGRGGLPFLHFSRCFASLHRCFRRRAAENSPLCADSARPR